MLIKFIVCLVAGIGAGLGTGFAGMSAAAVISPMLITFLDMDPYMAVGIALASDVLASAASAYTYGKNKNIDIKNGIVMMIFVLLFTLVGSFVSSKVPSTTMGGFSFVMTLFLGIKFIVKPVTEPKARLTQATPKQKNNPFSFMRCNGWLYLRLRWSRRRNDDASCAYIRSRI